MSGIRDLGDMRGLGPTLNEENESYSYHEWKCRVSLLFALLFIGGHFNVDEFHHVIERMDPAHYLEASYYGHWLHAFETLLLEKGVIAASELWGGSTLAPCAPGMPALTQNIVVMVVSTSASARVSYDIAPRSKAGDQVRAKNINPAIHARLSCYVRRKIGHIETDHGVLTTPGTTAHGLDGHPQHVYSVSFTALELWGTPRSDNVYTDLWNGCLEEA